MGALGESAGDFYIHGIVGEASDLAIGGDDFFLESVDCAACAKFIFSAAGGGCAGDQSVAMGAGGDRALFDLWTL